MNTSINNRYRLDEMLGTGGMGSVYRAYDRLNMDVVALKQVTIPKQHLDVITRAPQSVDHAAILAHEFSTLATLRHPNIISVLDYGFDAQQQPFFTMELITDGVLITDYAQQLEHDQRYALLVDILQALRYLHQRGILHRDLKPANILVADRAPKLLDFGLALDAQFSQSDMGAAGTLAYLAPEVLQGTPPSPQSDLYAFGLIAYELLTGEYPFPHETQTELIQRMLLDEPVLDSKKLDDAVLMVIMRLLAKDAGDRYGSALDTIRAICDAANITLPTETIEIRDSFLMASTFVGRDAEMQQLTDALIRMQDNDTQAILIGGESGVGKTRLLNELRAQALVQGITVVRGQAITGTGIPYKIWRDILPQLLLQADLSDADAALLRPLVPAIDRLLERDLPQSELTSDQLKARLPFLLTTVIRRAAEQIPLLILLEDLQWAADSITMLQQVVGALGSVRVMIVGNYRNDEASHLSEDLSMMQHITVSRFDEEQIRQLSTAMLGERGQHQNVLELIERESEGNAFFIVEVMRVLAEEAGQLSNVGLVTLPATVFAGGIDHVIRRRIEQLPDWAQHPVAISSVIGREIKPNLIANILPSLDIERWLNICGEVAVFDVAGQNWQFAHDKIRESVLANIDPERLKAMNRQVATAIETLFADDLERYASDLSDYYIAAEMPDHAAIYAGKGAIYLRHIDPPRAYVLSQRALDLNAHEQHDNPQHEWARLNHLHGRTAMMIDRYDVSRAALEQARIAFEAVGDELGVARVQNNIGELGFKTSQFDGVIATLEESLPILLAHEDWIEVGTAYMNLSIVHAQMGNIQAAMPYFEKTVTTMEATGDEIEMAKAYNNIGIAKDIVGEIDEGVAYHEKALEIRRRVNDPNGLASSLENLAAVEHKRGQYEKAKAMRQEALRYVRQTNSLNHQVRILTGLAQTEYASGNVEMARSYAAESLRITQMIDDRFGEITTQYTVAGFYQDEMPEIALKHYLMGLVSAQSVNMIEPKIQGILKAARLLTDAEHITQQMEAEWLSATLNFTKDSRWTDQVQDRLDQLSHLLDEEHYNTAIEKGKTHTLNDVIDSILQIGKIDYA